MKHALLYIFFFVFISIHLEAQNDINCAYNLVQAQELFEQGQIQEVPGLILGCIESGFSDQERIEAYKLLINAYIFDDYPSQAEKYMLEFLKKYPEYRVVGSDPPEFVNLLREFDNSPRASIGFQTGTNFSNIRAFEPFGIHNLNENPGEYKTSGIGFQAGFSFNLNILPRLEISLEPSYSFDKFGHEVTPFPFTRINYSEKQNRIDIPLSMIWLFPIDEFSPYIRAGLQGSFLFQANGYADRSYINTGNLSFNDIVSPEIDVLDRRNTFNYWAVIGTGIRYKIPRAYIFFDVRYNLGLKNQVLNSSRNLPEDDLVWLYYYMQDDFFMDDISFSIGIAKTLYRPKRKN